MADRECEVTKYAWLLAKKRWPCRAGIGQWSMLRELMHDAWCVKPMRSLENVLMLSRITHQ
jgi:hypothetical protein